MNLPTCFFRRPALAVALALSAAAVVARPVATFTVACGADVPATGIPVAAMLPANTSTDGALVLRELLAEGREAPVAFQREGEAGGTIRWMVLPRAAAPAERRFELRRGEPEEFGATMELREVDGTLQVCEGVQERLGYRHAVQAPPPGVAAAFARGGFIHPLCAPHGQVLTRIQAPDHYHHYGLWAPWTQVAFEGRVSDFWNLGEQQGTVRFVAFAGTEAGPVFAEYRAEQAHVVLLPEGGEKVALNEVQTVRVYRSASPDAYLLDLAIALRCAGPSPVLLLAHRYGGLGWRATGEWDKANSSVLTSEGLTRRDADGSHARWCVTQGAVDGGGDQAGVAWLTHPGNFNSPEPLRVWPEDQNGRGDVFVNFSPTKDRDWPLEPGKEYTLRYRFVVFNGRLDGVEAESAWRAFAEPPVVRVE